MHALILLVSLAVVPNPAPSHSPDAGPRAPQAPKKKQKKDHKGDSKDEEFRAFDLR